MLLIITPHPIHYEDILFTENMGDISLALDKVPIIERADDLDLSHLDQSGIEIPQISQSQDSSKNDDDICDPTTPPRPLQDQTNLPPREGIRGFFSKRPGRFICHKYLLNDR